MSMARHHAEWLSLVEISGPFLSLPVLLRVFPQGLPEREVDVARLLALAFEEWEDGGDKKVSDQALHTAWVRFVLTQTLGFPKAALREGQAIPETIKAVRPDRNETIRPDLVIVPVSVGGGDFGLLLDDEQPEAALDETPRLLVQVYARTQALERPARGLVGSSSPRDRMAELLLQTGLPLGLVTNGEEWTLVHRASETTGYATFYASLWREEPLTLRAFCALLGTDSLFAAPGKSLADLLRDSAADQQEVTDQLGYQVRKAVELLVQALDTLDRSLGGTLLADVPERTLYQGALTVMMRLVFLLCAEERELFPVRSSELYSRHYAVSTLLAQLREAADQHGEEILERRCDAWSRLLAIFKAIHGGVEHEDMRLPAYGGSLLDPRRFPWLDTPDSTPLPIHNRTVLHLLEALQILQVKIPGGGPAEARRLSFRALDIEQIGHVYEGLLDHTAVRAGELILGLAGTRDKEPEVPLSRLEELVAQGSKPLLAFLKEATGRSDKALEKALAPAVLDEGKLLIACEGDSALLARVRPLAGLVRLDDFGRFVVIPTGSVFVTSGSDRRSTGTHYTPRSLTEPVVRRTLEPLVYKGVSEGTAPSLETLRPPAELLALKVADIATGSGAFLVQACRYLSERLCEAWGQVERQQPGTPLTIPAAGPSRGELPERLVPASEEERLFLARRLVADRCLYGVDRNPMAVEMAKLSLWLTTMQKDRPFSFLDHAIKCGDSLVGCDQAQIRTWSLDGKGKDDPLGLFRDTALKRAIGYRQELEALPSETVEQVHHKAQKHAEAEAALTRVRLGADLIVAPSLGLAKPKEQETKRESFKMHFVAGSKNGEFDDQLRAEATTLLGETHPFHWPLEFPEVFTGDTSGFDAIVGNPPFIGGSKITGELGVPYREFLVINIAHGKKGNSDLVGYFYLRAFGLLKHGGTFGLIATNTIAQGDTREVGLDQLLGAGQIFAALPSMKWPGVANLEVAVVHLLRGEWKAPCNLDGRKVHTITAFLDDGTSSGKPFRLKENVGKSFTGNKVYGEGFVMEPEEAQALITKDPKNADVLFPYLNGEDLNSRPDQSPSRWVINFKDWPLKREENGRSWERSGEQDRKEWRRSGIVPFDYPESVATDYPDCLDIVERLVKPYRMTVNREHTRDKWWMHEHDRPVLYANIANLPRVLVITLHTKYAAFDFSMSNQVFSHGLAIISEFSGFGLAILCSTIYEAWAFTFGSSLGHTLRYTPSDCFETFPFPRLGILPTYPTSLNTSTESLGTMPENLGSTMESSGSTAKWSRSTAESQSTTTKSSGTPAEHQSTYAESPRTDAEAPRTLPERLDAIGETYHTHRKSICTARNLGLTKVYNLFHDPTCRDSDIAELRRLHTEMDTAVRDAYGWSDLDLRHSFYGEGKETRYTLHPDAKGEVLRRLLALNHARYAQEQQQNAADVLAGTSSEGAGSGKGKRGRKPKAAVASELEELTLELL